MEARSNIMLRLACPSIRVRELQDQGYLCVYSWPGLRRIETSFLRFKLEALGSSERLREPGAETGFTACCGIRALGKLGHEANTRSSKPLLHPAASRLEFGDQRPSQGGSNDLFATRVDLRGKRKGERTDRTRGRAFGSSRGRLAHTGQEKNLRGRQIYIHGAESIAESGPGARKDYHNKSTSEVRES
jgi:hypothetical protein